MAKDLDEELQVFLDYELPTEVAVRVTHVLQVIETLHTALTKVEGDVTEHTLEDLQARRKITEALLGLELALRDLRRYISSARPPHPSGVRQT